MKIEITPENVTKLRALLASFEAAEEDAEEQGMGMTDSDPLAGAYYAASDVCALVEKILGGLP